jgi:Cu-Zn family superoxide dismutase
MNPTKSLRPALALSTLIMLLAQGCAFNTGRDQPQAVTAVGPTNVAEKAAMTPEGRIYWASTPQGVKGWGKISGLLPGRTHGFHIHEVGDCSADGMATKGHFNPGGSAHGKHDAAAHHAGDLPSLTANAQGVAEFSFEVQGLRLDSSPQGIVGRAVIVHRDPDDFQTQPTGNAGPRPGCGLIQMN